MSSKIVKKAEVKETVSRKVANSQTADSKNSTQPVTANHQSSKQSQVTSKTTTRKNSTNTKKAVNSPSQFFKPSNTIMSRVNTAKINFLRERAYVTGNLRSTFDFDSRNCLNSIPEEKFHIKVKSQIDKELNQDDIKRNRDLAEKQISGLKEYTPGNNRSIRMKQCFNSYGIKGCLDQSHLKEESTTNYNINKVPVNLLNESAKNFGKMGNKTLNSHSMKMSLMG